MSLSSVEAIRKANLKRVVYLGVCNMTLFIAHSASQNLMPQIYKQLGYGRLGQINFFILYFGIMLASIVATHYHKKIEVKTGLLVSISTRITMIIAGFLATYCDKYNVEGGLCSPSFIVVLNLVGSACFGLTTSLYWLWQGIYVNQCADESVKGTFNGIFTSFIASSGILSYIIATVAFGKTDKFTFYCVLLFFAAIAYVLFWFIKPPVPYETVKEPLHVPEKTLAESLKTFVDILMKPRYFFIFFVMVFSGVGGSFFCSFLGIAVSSTIDSTDQNVINEGVAFVFILLSVGGVSTGLIIGRIADKYDKIKIVGYTMLAIQCAMIVTLIATILRNYQIAVLSGLLWGMSDTSVNTMISIVIGSRFNGAPELFSAYRFLNGVGCIFTTLLGIFMAKDAQIFYIMLVMGSLFVLQHHYYKYEPLKDERGKSLLQMQEEKLLLEMKEMHSHRASITV